MSEYNNLTFYYLKYTSRPKGKQSAVNINNIFYRNKKSNVILIKYYFMSVIL